MKRLILRVGVLFVLSVCAYATDITIGADLATTGPVASVGIQYKNALLLGGPSEIRGHKVRYIILDDASDPTNAVQNVKRMISDNNIDVLLGPAGTPLTLAVLGTIAEAKVPMMSLGSASSIVLPMDEKRKWAFKAVAGEDVQLDTMFNHMKKKGVQTLSMIVVNDPYGESYARVAREMAPKKGIKLLTVEKYDRNDPSTTAQALRAMQGNPDAIMIVALGTVAFTPHHALVERGYKGKIYQSGGAASPDFLQLGGKAVEGAYLVQSPALVAEQLPEGYPTKKLALNFQKLYQSMYGTTSFFGAQMWDGLNLVVKAIAVALKSAEPGTPEFREALRTAMENYTGVGATAVFSMSPTDHSGINEVGTSVMQIQNGTFKLDEAAKFK